MVHEAWSGGEDVVKLDRVVGGFVAAGSELEADRAQRSGVERLRTGRGTSTLLLAVRDYRRSEEPDSELPGLETASVARGIVAGS